MWLFMLHLGIWISSSSLLFSLQFFVCIFNINFPPTHTHSSIFPLTTACFTPNFCVCIKIWIIGVPCCSTFLVCLIYKTAFFLEALDVPSLYIFLSFFNSIQFFNFGFTLIPRLIFYDCIYQNTFSWKYIPSKRLNCCFMKLKCICSRFIVSSFWTSISYFPD